jgi:hypothetical protein
LPVAPSKPYDGAVVNHNEGLIMSQQTVAFGAEFDDTVTQLEELIDRLTENLADSLVQTAWALTQQARYHEEDLEPTLTK